MFTTKEGLSSFNPSQRRIKRMTRAFRRKWDEAERLLRAGYCVDVRLPVIKVDEIERCVAR